MKHLEHCTCHRPPPPQQQQQQQHTTASQPTPTLNDRYASMECAVECYNIDMQETQHLDHLSTALHLRPPMNTILVRHRAYKFQVVITVVCHKVVDPGVVTQPPLSLTSEIIALRGSAYIPLPRWIQTRRAFLNVAGTGDDCFKWAILAGWHAPCSCECRPQSEVCRTHALV